jgi:hypothetical protein
MEIAVKPAAAPPKRARRRRGGTTQNQKNGTARATSPTGASFIRSRDVRSGPLRTDLGCDHHYHRLARGDGDRWYSRHGHDPEHDRNRTCQRDHRSPACSPGPAIFIHDIPRRTSPLTADRRILARTPIDNPIKDFSQILDAVATASPSSINAMSTGVAEIDLPGKGQILVSQRSATSYSMATARVDRNVLSGRISIIAAAL